MARGAWGTPQMDARPAAYFTQERSWWRMLRAAGRGDDGEELAAELARWLE